MTPYDTSYHSHSSRYRYYSMVLITKSQKAYSGADVLYVLGASIMWLVDALFEYKEQGAGYFTPATADMINDSFLGICVVALGTVVWLGTMLISDPEGVVRKAITEKKQ